MDSQSLAQKALAFAESIVESGETPAFPCRVWTDGKLFLQVLDTHIEPVGAVVSENKIL